MITFFSGKKWQDWALAATDLIFAPALIPLLFSSTALPLTTSIPTAVGLWIVSITLWTLGLRLTPVTAMASAIMWTILLIQALV